jgi:hypothetical protein
LVLPLHIILNKGEMKNRNLKYLVLLLFIISNSCSIQKRQHLKGYHINFYKNYHSQNNEVNNTEKNDKPSKKNNFEINNQQELNYINSAESNQLSNDYSDNKDEKENLHPTPDLKNYKEYVNKEHLFKKPIKEKINLKFDNLKKNSITKKKLKENINSKKLKRILAYLSALLIIRLILFIGKHLTYINPIVLSVSFWSFFIFILLFLTIETIIISKSNEIKSFKTFSLNKKLLHICILSLYSMIFLFVFLVYIEIGSINLYLMIFGLFLQVLLTIIILFFPISDNLLSKELIILKRNNILAIVHMVSIYAMFIFVFSIPFSLFYNYRLMLLSKKYNQLEFYNKAKKRFKILFFVFFLLLYFFMIILSFMLKKN